MIRPIVAPKPLVLPLVLFTCLSACDGPPTEHAAESAPPEAESGGGEVEAEGATETTAPEVSEEAAEAIDLTDDIAVLRRATAETGGDPSTIGDHHAARCLTRPVYTQDVVVVGEFDDGCHLLGVFVGQVFHREARAAAEAILAEPAFAEADPRHKRLIAMTVVGEVLHAFEASDGFPQTASHDDGSVSVRITTSTGEEGEDAATHAYRIAADGSLTDDAGDE